ncbi:MAG: hypothetical protein QOC62_3365 [Mycobacterium sp.]|jgi:hypothetical protein|nr:hypothetical protein [Mycobacterium sp.]
MSYERRQDDLGPPGPRDDERRPTQPPSAEKLADPTANQLDQLNASPRYGALAARGRVVAASCHHVAPIPPVGVVPDIATVFVGTLLWAAPADVASVLDLVADDDIEAPALSVVLSTIRNLVADCRPCDAGLVADELRRTGELGRPVADALTAATVAGGPPESARFYGSAVVSDAFRRRVESAGHALIAAAAHNAEAQLSAIVSRATVACLDCAGRLAELRGEAA